MQLDITEIKTDVAVLKTDVAELKTDVAELKTDVAELKTIVKRIDNNQNEDVIAILMQIHSRSSENEYENLALNNRVGQNIIYLRERMTLRQDELSLLLNVDCKSIVEWEEGECLPDIEMLLRLTKVLKVSVEELLLKEYSSQSVTSDDLATIMTGNIWDNVLDEIGKQISKASFNTWFVDTTANLTDGTLVVYSPTVFITEWLQVRYSSLISRTFDRLTGESNIQLKFQVATDVSSNPH